MTIDPTWPMGWKAAVPGAHNKDAPADVRTVFIDGHLKLCCPKDIEVWDKFFRMLFKNNIERYLRMPGVQTVIIGFDDHLHSPLSKGPTQAARRTKTEHIEWSPHRPLPSEIPAHYDQLLYNREFKCRVIQYVIERIESTCRLHRPGSQRIIVDYQDEPYVAVGNAPSASAVPRAFPSAASAAASAVPSAFTDSANSAVPSAACAVPSAFTDSSANQVAVKLEPGSAASAASAAAPAAFAFTDSVNKVAFKSEPGSGAERFEAEAARIIEDAKKAANGIATAAFASAPGAPVAVAEPGLASAPPPASASAEEFCTGYIIPKTVPLGECDVKFVRYLHWGDIILDAVDSDYLIIGMCQVERLGPDAPRIFVRRLVMRPSSAVLNGLDEAAGVGKKRKPAAGDKRARDVFPEPGQHYPTLPAPTAAQEREDQENAAATAEAAARKTGRQYEYVDCGMLVRAMMSTYAAQTPAALRPYTIRLMAFAIALCGCDFTKGVMYMNATTFHRNAKLLWPTLCAAARVDAATGALVMDERGVAEGVVGRTWKKVQFPKLCNGMSMENLRFESLYQTLYTNETVSQVRRERLITPRALSCLVRNCNWSVFYWADPERCPCAVNGGDYGFVFGDLPADSTRKTKPVKRHDSRDLGTAAD